MRCAIIVDEWKIIWSGITFFRGSQDFLAAGLLPPIHWRWEKISIFQIQKF